MKRLILLPAFLLFVLAMLAAPPGAIVSSEAQDLGSAMPLDQNVKTGQFDNGLRYFIRVNKEPENRAQVWLAVNAGRLAAAAGRMPRGRMGATTSVGAGLAPVPAAGN